MKAYIVEQVLYFNYMMIAIELFINFAKIILLIF
jgi:hypothetical protein